jgi:DNA-binding SARP family transcriptional activator
MVRRLVIPIESPAVATAGGAQARPGWTVTEAATSDGVPAPEDAVEGPESDAPEVGTDPFAAAVVHSKVRSPAIRPTTLERPRLLNWLEQHATARLRIVTAEAGYGKSTLLADHSRRTAQRTIWYRLDSSDRDWVTFLSYIVAAVREVAPKFGAATVGLLQQVGVLNPTRDVTLGTLLAELESVTSEPLTLILDDFHTVQESEDVRAIVLRLLEHAPPGLSLVLSGRDRPTIPIARLAAQARVAELATEDLRFTRRETADLFASSYGTPIDDDLVNAIDERLEGWGASLQLVCASLLSLRPDEVRTFVRDLSAHSDPLYEFLAEEVLSRQTPVMRRVLTHGALLERISPHLVAAATADPRPVSVRQITVCLYRAEDTGLVSRAATGSGRWRFHPLVREFLQRRLLAALTDEQRIAMHLRIAVAAEPSDWLAAIHHYLEAGRPEDGMRVLRGSAIEALGTASWAQAIKLLDRMHGIPAPVAVLTIKAREYVARGQGNRAVEMLESLVPDDGDPHEWGLLRAALANAYMVTGQFDKVKRVADEILANPESPRVAISIARGYSTVLTASAGGSIADACDILYELGEDHSAQKLPYFAAVSFHNAALGQLARGRYAGAVGYALQAIDEFELTAGKPGVESTHALVAMALWELGSLEQAQRHLEQATARDDSPADAQADGAWMLGASGDVDGAWLLLGRAARAAIDGSSDPGVNACMQYTRALVCLVSGNARDAEAALDGASEGSIELDTMVRHAAMLAMVALANGRDDEALVEAERGKRTAIVQGASHWEMWLQLIAAVAGQNRDNYRQSLLAMLSQAQLSTLALADVIVTGLHLLDAVPPSLEDSIAAWPERWLRALRNAVRGDDAARAQLSAQLLAKFGTLEDVALLTAYERSHVTLPVRRVLGRQLARHANPTLMLHDLGHITFDVGQRTVAVSQSRRRAASLFAFLASRPNHSSTKEQVLEALWPSQSPAGAANSLHQTLFYLRRDIDPYFNEAHSVHYLVVEPDLVYFDSELVQVDSAAFLRQAGLILLGDNIGTYGRALLKDYRAPFAQEFEYEDWSMAWRDRVHTTYLQLAQRTSETLLKAGAVQQGIDVISRALVVDPAALDLEASLVMALLDSGATAAAAHQYAHFAKVYEEDLGATPPSLSDLFERKPDVWPALRRISSPK